MNESKYAHIKQGLEQFLDYPVSVVVTDNVRSIISVRKKNGSYSVLLHHMFLNADNRTIEALGEFISARSNRISKHIKAFIGKNKSKIKNNRGFIKERKIKLIHKGRHFDLMISFQKLNNEYFNGECKCHITWGYRRKKKSRKSVRLGSYSSKKSLIRINPILDNIYVPTYVLESIIYHEMLHHILGSKEEDNRQISHFKDFKEREQEFRYYVMARRWIKDNLHHLLR